MRPHMQPSRQLRQMLFMPHGHHFHRAIAQIAHRPVDTQFTRGVLNEVTVPNPLHRAADNVNASEHPVAIIDAFRPSKPFH